jgi:hypothetical protein
MLKDLFSPVEILTLRHLESPRETVRDRPLTREEAERSDLIYTISRLAEAIASEGTPHAEFCVREACKIIKKEWS